MEVLQQACTWLSLLLLGDLYWCAAVPRHVLQPRCPLLEVWGPVLLPFWAHQRSALALLPLQQNIKTKPQSAMACWHFMRRMLELEPPNMEKIERKVYTVLGITKGALCVGAAWYCPPKTQADIICTDF